MAELGLDLHAPPQPSLDPRTPAEIALLSPSVLKHMVKLGLQVRMLPLIYFHSVSEYCNTLPKLSAPQLNARLQPLGGLSCSLSSRWEAGRWICIGSPIQI